MKNLYLIFPLLLSFFCVRGQMLIDGQVFYGNEWIDIQKTYVKMTLSDDGVYKVGFESLSGAGVPVSQIEGREIQVFHMGRQIPVFVSNNGQLSNDDYILFVGRKNRGELDKHLYEDWANEQLNLAYSMFTDEAAYYLTWEAGSDNNPRYSLETNNLSGNLPLRETHYMHEETIVFSNFHKSPGINADNVKYSHFANTEGFGSNLRKVNEVVFNVTDLYQSGPDPHIDIRMGSNRGSHAFRFDINNKFVFNDAFTDQLVKSYTIDFEISDLTPQTTLKVSGLSDEFDYSTIASSTLTYPRVFNAQSASLMEFAFPANAFRRYFEIENFDIGGDTYVIDLDNGTVRLAEQASGVVRFAIAPTTQNSRLIVVSEGNGFRQVSSMAPASFRSFDSQAGDYLIMTSKRLDVDDANGTNQLRAYADFRSSEAGDNYTPVIIYAEDLYEHFSYGVQNHCIAIRNFSQYIKTRWPNLKMAVIIGKALEYQIDRKGVQGVENRIPTWGDPGSDNLLFADPGKSYPYIPVGRIAAQTPENLEDYLDKVKAHASYPNVENLSIQERLWLKNILHLSGGSSQEQEILFNHLRNMENIISDVEYAANVTTFKKSTADPVQTTLSQSIIDRINFGQSVITFFGHSAVGTFDFSIEDPSKYDNFGKYPLILSLGCHSGNIHTTAYSLSEDFVLIDGLGAIGFMASSGTAYISAQAAYGYAFYELLRSTYYGQPVGYALRDVLESQFDAGDFKKVTLHEQLTFHGDPALKLFSAAGPDYIVDFNTIRTSVDVNVSTESFDLVFDIVNLGSGVRDSIDNYIVHSYGDNNNDTIHFKSVAPMNKVEVRVPLVNPGLKAVGKNTVNIVLDQNNAIPELPDPVGEINNDLKAAYNIEGYCFFILDNAATPIDPYEFAIVNTDDITLRASTNNAFAEPIPYKIEIDTTELFDSPLVQTTEVISRGGLIEWTPAVNYTANTVYYWRVQPVPQDTTEVRWANSSFIYMPGSSEGWNQSHFYQWLKDDFDTYLVDSTTRAFSFADDIKDIKVSNGVFPSVVKPELTFQSTPYRYIEFLNIVDNGIRAGLYIAVFDPSSGEPMFNQPPGLHESSLGTPWARNFAWFPFRTNSTEERAKAINFLDNVVPDNAYVIVMTIQRDDLGGSSYLPENWAGDNASLGTDLFTVFEANGASQVRTLEATGSIPYILMYQKGNSDFETVELFGDLTSELEFNTKIAGKWFEGSMISRTIGPAEEWDQLLWNVNDIDFFEDEYKLDIIGINAAGDETVLFQNVDEFIFNLSPIKANQYPRIKLNYYTKDSISRSSPQIEYWRVLYKEKPEAVLNTDNLFVFNADTLFQGDQLMVSTVADNITDSDMDSLLVKFTIVDKQNNEVNRFMRAAPLPGNGRIPLAFEYPTDGLVGIYEFRMEINPAMDQPEQFAFNNLGVRRFEVFGDRLNPLLDVTFDGVRIMNGDIVAPNALISVIAKDENTFLFMQDPETFELALRLLPDGEAETIDLNSDAITFYPADTTGENVARLEYQPDLKTGEYELIVQAKDVSGNFSGDQAYTVRFKVVEESMVSNVLNYPNPFSTSTEFVFTLTGYKVPEVFTIRIMTLSGKVVKEITKEQLGNLRIGLNRSEYKWDGRDDYGSKLANGVYLYKVFTSDDNQESFDHFANNDIDAFFKKGFGKLVILR